MPLNISGSSVTGETAKTFRYNNIVKRGLVLHLDASINDSYPQSGTTWYDISGNNNNVTLINGPTFSSTNGGIITFDGVNDYGAVTLTDASLDGGNTIEIFVKRPTTPPSWRTYINIKPLSTNVPFYEFRTTDANLITVLDYYNPGNVTDYYTTSYTIDTTNYWHLVGTYDGATTTTFYVNGNLVGTATTPAFALGTSPRISLGLEYSEYRPANIILPICRIYNRALTINEIKQNFLIQIISHRF